MDASAPARGRSHDTDLTACCEKGPMPIDSTMTMHPTNAALLPCILVHTAFHLPSYHGDIRTETLFERRAAASPRALGQLNQNAQGAREAVVAETTTTSIG